MICETGCCNVLAQNTTIHIYCKLQTYTYTKACKLNYLHNGCCLRVAQRLALLKRSPYLCRYRRTELYLLPCARKRTVLIPGSIAIIVDLHKNVFSSKRLIGLTVTSYLMPLAGKGGPLVGSQSYGFSFFGM